MIWWRRLLAALAPSGAVAAPRLPAAPIEALAPPLGPVDRDILIRTVWGEARGDPPAGWAGVVHVVRNRATDARQRWPRRVAAACQQPAQFSCWNVDDVNRRKMEGLTPFAAAYREIGAAVDAAWMAPDSVAGANHYYAPAAMPAGKPPRWATGQAAVARVGRHLVFLL